MASNIITFKSCSVRMCDLGDVIMLLCRAFKRNSRGPSESAAQALRLKSTIFSPENQRNQTTKKLWRLLESPYFCVPMLYSCTSALAMADFVCAFLSVNSFLCLSSTITHEVPSAPPAHALSASPAGLQAAAPAAMWSKRIIQRERTDFLQDFRRHRGQGLAQHGDCRVQSPRPASALKRRSACLREAAVQITRQPPAAAHARMVVRAPG